MDCRKGCAICCIYPSISSPLPAMPEGKPAMIPCPHLTHEKLCELFNSPVRPAVCIGFKPELWICGSCNEEAIENFLWLLEHDTK